MRKLALLIATVLVVSACSRDDASPAASAEVADSVYTNGRIYTVEGDAEWAEAVAIKDGKFMVVGSADDAAAVIGDSTNVVDLEGRFVMPGLIDPHTHMFEDYHNQNFAFGIEDNSSMESILAAVAAHVEANPGDGWITGGNYPAGLFPNDSPPKEALDGVVPDRPICIADQSAHAWWCNSRALEITGILGDTKLREGAIIDRDADGNVAGTVREHAIGHMRQFIPPVTQDEWEAVGRGFMDWLSSMGITTVQLAAGNEAHLKAATKIEADGDLSVRLAVALNYGYFDSAESLDEEYEFIQRAGAYKTEFVDPGYTKIFMDGVPTAKTGWMVEPYVDSDEDFRGSGYYDADDLNRIYADFTEKGVSVMAHATGSRSVREVLNAIENAQKAFPDSPVRHHLTHNGSVHADDVGRYAELGITADLAPIFPIPPFLAKSAEPMLGKERVDNYTNPRPILNAGGEVAIGSDWSVSPIDPWNRLAFVVSRQDANNLDWGVMQPENAITVAEAIRAYTWGPAHAINKENETGSIEVGKYADMIVLDRNPFEIDPIEIAGTQVLTTVFAGKEVYEAGDK